MNQRTKNYVFTFHPTDRNDIKRLQEVKRMVSEHNKTSPNKIYVKLQGRLGANNPNAAFYRGRGSRAYQCIRKEHASYFDVYIYERY